MKKILAACIGVLGAFVLSGCGGYDADATTTLYLPDYEIFKAQVHPYLNRQCGTLDCHGAPGRPFRVQGFWGLRRFVGDGGLVPGDEQTTEEEFRGSFESLIGLEPEATRRVVAGEQAPGSLLILRKPTGTGPAEPSSPQDQGERHKGGRVTSSSGPGYQCIAAWLTTPAGTQLSEQGQVDCRAAQALP